MQGEEKASRKYRGFVLDRNPMFKWTRRLMRTVSNNVELLF